MKDGPIKVPTKYIALALYIALTLRLVHFTGRIAWFNQRIKRYRITLSYLS